MFLIWCLDELLNLLSMPGVEFIQSVISTFFKQGKVCIFNRSDLTPFKHNVFKIAFLLGEK